MLHIQIRARPIQSKSNKGLFKGHSKLTECWMFAECFQFLVKQYWVRQHVWHIQIINYFLVRTFIFFIIFDICKNDIYMTHDIFFKQPCKDTFLMYIFCSILCDYLELLIIIYYYLCEYLKLPYCWMCLSPTYQNEFLVRVKLLVWSSWAALCSTVLFWSPCVCPGQSLGGHAAPPVQPRAAGREEQQHGADGGRRTGGRDPGTPPEEPLRPRRPAQQGQQMWALTCDERRWNDAWYIFRIQKLQFYFNRK